MQALNFILIILLVVLFFSAVAFVLLLIKAIDLRRKLNSLKQIRESDITETNNLFIEKSENELKLFFQFETVLEELVKMIRKNDTQLAKLVENQNDIKIILEYHLKK
jgi:uncharacterized protein HemX